MHKEALDWVHGSFHDWRQEGKSLDVLEIGSLNINGSPRPIIEPFSKTYYGIDMQEGPGVDQVMDAAGFLMPESFDVIICCEVFEHTPDWKKIIANSAQNLRVGGIFIATMAGEGRRPHSAIDENPIRDWEYYDNIGEWNLKQTLKANFSKFNTSYANSDLRCWAVK